MYDIDLDHLQWFTFVPAWVIQDAIVIVLAVVVVGFILRHERRPGPVLLEFFCFVFLYAAVYENFATVVGWYQYGHSLAMVFNVPISVPIVEYLFVYAAIRMGLAMRIPTWTIPILAGAMGMLEDLLLDPLALSQVVETAERTIGRWTWYIGPTDVNYFGSPVYNYTGWVLICGYASAFLLLGRWWYRRSGEKLWVGIVYPIAAMLGALAVMVSPLSSFLLWLGPFATKGGWTEYLMFGIALAALIAVIIAWRGRMRRPLTWREDWAIPVVFGTVQLTSLVFICVGGLWNILGPSLVVVAVQFALIAWAFLGGKDIRRTAAFSPLGGR